MRLGQLSRKLDLKPTEIRELIRKEFNVEIDLDPNTRLEDAHADAIAAKYQPTVEQAKEPLKQPETAVETHPLHTPIEVPHYHEASHTTEPKENPDAFIPLPVDPTAELIKAPKIKLEGLKVVGKIDLPKPKEIATESITEETETVASEANGQAESHSPKSFKERRLKSAAQQNNDDEEYSIFKDKKGIYHFSQTQRENRKNSLERIKRQKQEELRKQKKVKHYQQLVESEKKVESPAKKAKKQASKEVRKKPEKPVRKGLWGKFLNWLNG